MIINNNNQNFDPHFSAIEGEVDFPLYNDELKVDQRETASQAQLVGESALLIVKKGMPITPDSCPGKTN